MYQFLFFFFVYAFLGWCTEVSYAALVTGRFVNRGFLNGPWCPVYGFGVVIVLAFLEPLKSNLLLLFLGSVVLTSALEWATGFVLEKIFHQRWWDYSDQPFNLNGYICLRFSIAWGLACLFVVKLLHPSVLLIIRLVPRGLGWTLLALLAAVMAVDLAATVRTIAKLNRRLSQLDQLAAKIKDASNDFGEDLAERVLDAAEKGSDWKEELEELTDRLAQRQEGLRAISGKTFRIIWRSAGSNTAASFRIGRRVFRSCWTGTALASTGCSRPSLGSVPPGTRRRWSGCADAWASSKYSVVIFSAL